MSSQAFVLQEIIDASILDPNDLRCPRCQGNTLVLSGQAQMPQREVMEKGTITAQIPTTEGGSFNVEQIDCLPCNVRFEVREPKLFQLERENLNLKDEITELQIERESRNGGPGSSGVAIRYRQ